MFSHFDLCIHDSTIHQQVLFDYLNELACAESADDF